MSINYLRRSSRVLRLLALFFFVHALAAIGLAPSEKRTVGVIVGVLGLNVVVAFTLVYVSRGVQEGRRLTAAVCLVWFLFMGALMAGAVAVATGYEGAWLLMPVQITFLGVLLWATIVLTRALMFINSGGWPKSQDLEN